MEIDLLQEDFRPRGPVDRGRSGNAGTAVARLSFWIRPAPKSVATTLKLCQILFEAPPFIRVQRVVDIGTFANYSNHILINSGDTIGPDVPPAKLRWTGPAEAPCNEFKRLSKSFRNTDCYK